MRMLRCALLCLLTVLPGAAIAATPQPQEVDGIYRSNSNSYYYVHYVGDAHGGTLFWYGENPDGGFSNVMQGLLHTFDHRREYAIDHGQWLDVPKGHTRGGSDPLRPRSALTLDWRNRIMQRSTDTGGGFGDHRWTRLSNGLQPPHMSANATTGAAGPGVDGVWLGDDGGLYFVRRQGRRLAWFGESCSGGASADFANVYVAQMHGDRADGNWADVPYGRTHGHGRLSVRVTPTQITRLSASGGFGGHNWHRASALGGDHVRALRLQFTSGSDGVDARSVVQAQVVLRSGDRLPLTRVNDPQHGWQHDQTHVAVVTLPAGTTLHDLKALELHYDGAPRSITDNYDVWDVRQLRIQAETPHGRLCLASLTGRSGFVRFYGHKTFASVPLQLP